MILTVAFLDRKIVDACNSKAGKSMLIVLSILVSMGTEPVAAVVTKLIGEADSNPVFTKGPDLLDEDDSPVRATICGLEKLASARVRKRTLRDFAK
jgi:hypothetical protein